MVKISLTKCLNTFSELRNSTGRIIAILIGFALLIYLPNGNYLGGDWGLPATQYQANNFFYPWTWSSAINFGIPNFIGILGLPFQFFIQTAVKSGFPIEYLGKSLLALLFSLAYLFLYGLLRYLKLGVYASIAGGLVYITTPVFFNYSLMGWQFALFAMALFPLAIQWLCQSVREDNLRYAVGVSFVWSLAALQSQSLIWLPLLFFGFGFYLIHDRLSAQVFFKKIGIIFALFIGLNGHWWFPIAIFQDENITSGAIVLSQISVGADSKFNTLNALRLWGSLFNFQYESAMSNGLLLCTWLLPIIMIMAFFSPKTDSRRIATIMGLFAIMLPISLLLLNGYREILAEIPGAGLIRQLSRFTVLTSFAYAVLIAILLDSLASSRRFLAHFFLCAVSAMLITSIWPWWTGQLLGSNSSGPDFRLRVKSFSHDYYAVENYLSHIGMKTRALYLPYGMSSSYKDDPKFRGMFNEAVDVFAAYSPVPGIFMPNDRPSPTSDYTSYLQAADSVVTATRFTPTNLYIVRENLDSEFEQYNFSDEFFDKIWSGELVKIYARKSTVPLIYSPSIRQLHNGFVDDLDEVISSPHAGDGMAVIFSTQNLAKDVVNKFVSGSTASVGVEYRRINPTKYRIRLHNARENVPLLFGEGFSRGWRLYPIAYKSPPKGLLAQNETTSLGLNRYQANSLEINDYSARGWISFYEKKFISKRFFGSIENDNLPTGSLMDTWNSSPLPEGQHIKINGYANGWLVDIEYLCARSEYCHRNSDGSIDAELIMEFWPQQAFYFGLAITAFTLMFSIYLLFRTFRKVKVCT